MQIQRKGIIARNQNEMSWKLWCIP